ncbi:MAG: heterodisulfide reductase-related iron-sulfur binding cluster [Candidatus Hodarchaeota archaeon]
MLESNTCDSKINKNRLSKVPGLEEGIYYFLGCTERTYPGINASFIQICNALNINIHTSTKQSCCTGNFLPFNVAPIETVTSFTQRNYNIMKQYSKKCVTSCNGCFSSFQNCDAFLKGNPNLQSRVKDVMKKIGKDYIEDMDVFHIAEYFYKNQAEVKPLVKHSLKNVNIAIHYGCHFLHQEDPEVILDDVENPTILEEIFKGFNANIIEYKEKMLCCGAGLNQRILFEDRMNSLLISLKKLASINAHQPDAVVVICPYCQVHLDNVQAELEVEFDEEFDIPILHVNELIGILMDFSPDVLHLDVHKVSVDPFLEKLGYQG